MKAPGWLRITTPDRRVATVVDVRVLWWHPGAWWALLKACLRLMGWLSRHCDRCQGAGRLGRTRYLRRRACPDCAGTGKARKVA